MMLIKEQKVQSALKKITDIIGVAFVLYVPNAEDTNYYWNTKNLNSLIDKDSRKIKSSLLNQCGRFKCITIDSANDSTCDSCSDEMYERLLTGLYIGASKFRNDVGDRIADTDFLIGCGLDRNEIDCFCRTLFALAAISKEEYDKMCLGVDLL